MNKCCVLGAKHQLNLSEVVKLVTDMKTDEVKTECYNTEQAAGADLS